MIDSDWCLKKIISFFTHFLPLGSVQRYMCSVSLVAMIPAVACRYCKMNHVGSAFLPNDSVGILLKNKTF